MKEKLTSGYLKELIEKEGLQNAVMIIGDKFHEGLITKEKLVAIMRLFNIWIKKYKFKGEGNGTGM